jgi:hypothetical protein
MNAIKKRLRLFEKFRQFFCSCDLPNETDFLLRRPMMMAEQRADLPMKVDCPFC